MIDLFRFFVILFSGLFLFIGCATDDHPDSPPNILLIVAGGDVAVHGNADLETPRIDALARGSVQLDAFYAQPADAPSRATLLTGRHFLKTGVWGDGGGRHYLHPDERTIAQVLTESGYYTALIGQWQLGEAGPYLPQTRGFEDTWRLTNQYAYFEPLIDHNGSEIMPRQWTVDYLTDRAIACLDSAGQRPLFLYLAYPQIHEPYRAVDSLVEKYQGRGLSLDLATRLAMTEQQDDNLGRLLDELEARGLDRNTAVLYLGSNDPVDFTRMTPEEKAPRNSLERKGDKGSVSGNGARVPAFIRWPRHFPARVVTEVTTLSDIFPTIVELSGAGLPPDQLPLDGLSLFPLLEGREDTLPLRPIFLANHESRWPDSTGSYRPLPDRNTIRYEDADLAVRLGQYRYVQSHGRSHPAPGIALYDLAADPREAIDLSNSLPQVRDQLAARLEQWWTEEIFRDPHSYHQPVFYPGYPGEIFNSAFASAPVAVYGSVEITATDVRNWSRPGDGVDLPIEVLKTGPYQVRMELEPGLRPGMIILDIGKQSRRRTVGQEKLLDFGVMDLPEGPATLSVRLAETGAGEEAVIQSLQRVLFQFKGGK